MKVKLRITIEHETDLALNANDNDDAIHFFYEEHFCADNLFIEIANEIEEKNNIGFCATCYKTEVQVLEIKRNELPPIP